MTELERLQAENEYLRAENAVLKKLRVLQRTKRKMKIVRDLVTEFPFHIILSLENLMSFYCALILYIQDTKNHSFTMKEWLYDNLYFYNFQVFSS